MYWVESRLFVEHPSFCHLVAKETKFLLSPTGFSLPTYMLGFNQNSVFNFILIFRHSRLSDLQSVS